MENSEKTSIVFGIWRFLERRVWNLKILGHYPNIRVHDIDMPIGLMPGALRCTRVSVVSGVESPRLAVRSDPRRINPDFDKAAAAYKTAKPRNLTHHLLIQSVLIILANPVE